MKSGMSGSEVWTVGKLVDSIRSPESVGVRVEVPRFQRRIVWSREQREGLIESIHRGYPIGSILLSKRAGTGEAYELVDGLQRTSTLLAYSERPLLLAPVDALPSQTLVEVAAVLGSELGEVTTRFHAWMKRVEEMTFAKGFTPTRLVEAISAGQLPLNDDAAARLEALAEKALDALRDNVSIGAVQLPVVTYTGPESELPEIFDRINSSGTKLSKYEIFAAAWISKQTLIKRDEIRSAITLKYQALLDAGFTIEGLERDVAISDFNLFEYLFGLGKVLKDKFSLLFAGSEDPTEVEPFGFSLVTVAAGLQLAKMKQLYEGIPTGDDMLLDPSEIEEHLFEAAQKVNDWLKPFLGLRLNSTSSQPFVAHGELQMVSMIARTLVGRWDPFSGWIERPDWQADWAALEVAMPQHYLQDVIQDRWRGPLYSICYERVWEKVVDADGSEVGMSPSTHYARPVDRPSIDNVLNTWFDGQKRREQRSRPYIRTADKVFLKFLYTGILSNLEEQGSTLFELEHLFPVSRLRDLIDAGEAGWPISCIANLALYTKQLNREKTKTTIAEYLTTQPVSAAIREQITRLTLVDPSTVDIPPSWGRSHYEAFLDQRWSVMKKRLYESLKVEDAGLVATRLDPPPEAIT